MIVPREHGAYGQLALPLVTALGVGGVSVPALLLVAGAVAAFLAHEPASILLGYRGSRARREMRTAATGWLLGCAGVAGAAGAIAALSIDGAVRWSLAVPAVPAAIVGAAIVRGHEKSSMGEVAVAATFAALAIPVAMVAGAPARAAAAIAIPFGLLFVAGTLAVRTVILRVRGGGDPRAATLTRRGAIAVALGGAAGLAWLGALGALPAATLAAAAPGLMLALVVAGRPPQPARLRAIGWTLVAVSVFAAMVLVAAI